MGIPWKRAGEADCDTERLISLVRSQEPLEGNADVAALLCQALEPLSAIRAGCLVGGVFAIVQEVLGMTILDRRAVLELRSALGRELAHGIQHPQARLRVAPRVGTQQ